MRGLEQEVEREASAERAAEGYALKICQRHATRLSQPCAANRWTCAAATSMIAVYWKPVYKYLRLKWNLAEEEAKDATQDFFARAIEKRFFDAYDPAKARFPNISARLP